MATPREETERRMTIEEFERLPESDEYLFELSRGVLVREPRPGPPHGAVAALLIHYLTGWALDHGGVVTTESGYLLAEDPAILRGPDIAWRAVPEPYRVPDRFIRGAPDLAVEILSPSDRPGRLREKIEQYFDAGSSQVWLVDPGQRSVEVLRAPDRRRTLGASDTLDGGALLPGFALPVAAIFRF